MMRHFVVFAIGLLTFSSAWATNPERDGSFEPVVSLKDKTSHFPGNPDRPKPKDGWWVTPIHATALPDGRALISGWGRYDFNNCQIHRTRQNGTSFILDPATLTGGADRLLSISPIDESPRPGTSDVLYCAGNVTMRDGRILYVGGARYEYLGDKPGEKEYGLNYFRVFDPRTGKFERHDFAPAGGPDRNDAWYEPGMMWYPTETRLPGGKILVAGGFTHTCSDGTCLNRDIEVFDTDSLERGENPWSTLIRHESSPAEIDPGIKDYTHSLLLYEPAPSGAEVVMMGWPGKIVELALDGHVRVGSGRPGGAAAWDSSAALLGTGEIMIVGGGPDPKNEAQRIDLYNPRTGRWRSRNTGITRHNPSTTLLPDGTVLIMNGEAGDDASSAIGDRHRPQIYDPYTDELATLAPWDDSNPADRGYHNFSLLLKDGRVMLGGGMVTLAQVGCERPDARIFNPPYLYKGERPRAVGLEDGRTIAIGSRFTLRYESSKPLRQRGGVALLALGSETHSFDQNQRYVPLDFRELGPARIEVTTPVNHRIAPEGDYFLYLVNEAGVPSEGVHVRVSN